MMLAQRRQRPYLHRWLERSMKRYDQKVVEEGKVLYPWDTNRSFKKLNFDQPFERTVECHLQCEASRKNHETTHPLESQPRQKME